MCKVYFQGDFKTLEDLSEAVQEEWRNLDQWVVANTIKYILIDDCIA